MIIGVSYSHSFILTDIIYFAALTDDVLNNTKTDSSGNFIISGSSSEVREHTRLLLSNELLEWYGNKFFIEIKVPCWEPLTATCNSMAQM